MQKYSAPTRFDFQPVGTIWEHMTDGPTGDLYIQTADNTEAPEWVPLADLLLAMYRSKALEPQFIRSLINHHRSC